MYIYLVREVRFVFGPVAVLPLPDGLPDRVVEPCQLSSGKRGFSDSLRIRRVVRTWLCRAGGIELPMRNLVGTVYAKRSCP